MASEGGRPILILEMIVLAHAEHILETRSTAADASPRIRPGSQVAGSTFADSSRSPVPLDTATPSGRSAYAVRNRLRRRGSGSALKTANSTTPCPAKAGNPGPALLPGVAA